MWQKDSTSITSHISSCSETKTGHKVEWVKIAIGMCERIAMVTINTQNQKRYSIQLFGWYQYRWIKGLAKVTYYRNIENVLYSNMVKLQTLARDLWPKCCTLPVTQKVGNKHRGFDSQSNIYPPSPGRQVKGWKDTEVKVKRITISFMLNVSTGKYNCSINRANYRTPMTCYDTL